jgi:dipeptidase
MSSNVDHSLIEEVDSAIEALIEDEQQLMEQAENELKKILPQEYHHLLTTFSDTCMNYCGKVQHETMKHLVKSYFNRKSV